MRVGYLRRLSPRVPSGARDRPPDDPGRPGNRPTRRVPRYRSGPDLRRPAHPDRTAPAPTTTSAARSSCPGACRTRSPPGPTGPRVTDRPAPPPAVGRPGATTRYVRRRTAQGEPADDRHRFRDPLRRPGPGRPHQRNRDRNGDRNRSRSRSRNRAAGRQGGGHRGLDAPEVPRGRLTRFLPPARRRGQHPQAGSRAWNGHDLRRGDRGRRAPRGCRVRLGRVPHRRRHPAGARAGDRRGHHHPGRPRVLCAAPPRRSGHPGGGRGPGRRAVLRPDGCADTRRHRPRPRTHLPQPRVPGRHPRRPRVHLGYLGSGDQDQFRAVPDALPLHLGRAGRASRQRQGPDLLRQGRGPAVH